MYVPEQTEWWPGSGCRKIKGEKIVSISERGKLEHGEKEGELIRAEVAWENFFN